MVAALNAADVCQRETCAFALSAKTKPPKKRARAKMTNEFHEHLKGVVSRADAIVQRMDRLRFIEKSEIVIERASIRACPVRQHEAQELLKLVALGAEAEMQALSCEYESLKIEFPLCQ